MATEWIMGLGALAAGFSGGVLSGLFGIGGGIILIPLLALLLRLPQHQAQGVTLAALLLPNGLPAVLHFRRRGIRVHWPLVGFLVLAFLPAVWAGARLANLIPDRPLRMGFGSFLLLMALRTWFHRPAPNPAGTAAPALARQAWAGLAAGAAGGVASGLLGIGGGIIVIPMLVWSLRLSQHEAQAACLAFMLAPIGLPGVVVYAQSQGGLPWLMLAGIACGFMAGAYAGARLATRMHDTRLRKAFGVLLACAGLMMLGKG